MMKTFLSYYYLSLGEDILGQQNLQVLCVWGYDGIGSYR